MPDKYIIHTTLNFFSLLSVCSVKVPHTTDSVDLALEIHLGLGLG